MGTSEEQDKLEETIIQQLVFDRQNPGTVVRGLLSGPNPPDPLQTVFALTTVAADLSGWHEPELQDLSSRCFEEATLMICELWAAGFRLTKPKVAKDQTAEQREKRKRSQTFSTTTEPTE
ncbi:MULTISPECIES: hypothetical protein [Roseobacteraceae]|uniref:Uncharacterized protein n=1 Tax=Celeribacter baekdonensis B30 TaxID=1208323 RepID=K2ICU7_9RHOB|nr:MULTISPECIES: hypothetical protein [Roseobacteraceae]EKE67781.1 hypothetical protein B30_19402 [Celeribacter baekdonensis B30]KAB6716111.1 hypothetical protein C8029_11700 [Roseobacter sp. TSBP12]